MNAFVETTKVEPLIVHSSLLLTVYKERGKNLDCLWALSSQTEV